MRMAKSVAAALAVAGLASVSPAATVTIFSVASTPWQSSDATLGLTGANIVDFESTALPAGVTVSVTSPAGSYGPTSTLPFLFDPAVNDPNAAKVLVPGIWDGSHVFVNRLDANVPLGYVDTPVTKWGSFTFGFPTGTTLVGFSVGQMELVQTLSVNGSPLAFLDNSNFPLLNQRNGYLVITAGIGETISSVSIGAFQGDGYSIDHLAYVVPEPASLTLLSLASLLLQRRRV